MALAESVPVGAAANEEAIKQSLAVRDQSDSALARVLFDSQKYSYYRLFGFRSLQEYLRERFRGTELDGVARLHARGVQRLIREYKLALEIPAFAAAFDKISRSNRRLIAQVITLETAEDWILKALTLNTRELEALVTKKESKSPSVIRKRLFLTPEQNELVERALEIAGRLLAEDGQDPLSSEGGRFTTICQEFIATYGEGRVAGPFSMAECPACRALVSMKRTPEEDPGEGEGRPMLTYECGRCKARLVMVSLL